MENWRKHLDAAERFLRSAKTIIKESPEIVPIIAHRALEHLIMALVYKLSPSEAPLLDSHGKRRSWLTRVIRSGILPYELLSIYDELSRIYKRSTYLLENSELAREALDLAEKALEIIRGKLGVEG